MKKKFLNGFFLLLIAVTSFSRNALAEPSHPLDALEAAEINRTAAILRAEGYVDEQTRFCR